MEFGNEILKKINKDTNKESIIKDILGYLDKEFKKENVTDQIFKTFVNKISMYLNTKIKSWCRKNQQLFLRVKMDFKRKEYGRGIWNDRKHLFTGWKEHDEIN